jgi:hypothetical protein
MGTRRGWFGPNKDEVWRQLAAEIGADWVDGGFWKGTKVVAHVKEWDVTLDTYAVSTGHTHVVYTRMRAPYVNPGGFRFRIYRRGPFTGLGKKLGMQDIEIGFSEFDEEFVVKSNDEAKVRDLLEDESLRELLRGQPTIDLSVKDDEGWFGARFPEGADELCFQVVGIITDQARLKGLFDLFSTMLDRLCQIGAAYEDDPNVTL